MPGVHEIASFSELVRTAVKACGYDDVEVRLALEAIPPEVDWNGARTFAAERPQVFHVASTLASAAYYMAPQVLDRLGYPVERQHPADVEEFLAEYETGIIDPVTKRGRRYLDA